MYVTSDIFARDWCGTPWCCDLFFQILGGSCIGKSSLGLAPGKTHSHHCRNYCQLAAWISHLSCGPDLSGIATWLGKLWVEIQLRTWSECCVASSAGEKLAVQRKWNCWDGYCVFPFCMLHVGLTSGKHGGVAAAELFTHQAGDGLICLWPREMSPRNDAL